MQPFAEGVYVVAVADSEFHHSRTHFVVERPGSHEGLPVLFIRTFRIALTERADFFTDRRVARICCKNSHKTGFLPSRMQFDPIWGRVPFPKGVTPLDGSGLFSYFCRCRTADL